MEDVSEEERESGEKEKESGRRERKTARKNILVPIEA